MTTTTLRLPDELAEALRDAATKRGRAVSDLVRSLIDAYLREEEERQLYDDFTLLGSDPEGSNVEHTIPAASEVVLRDG